MSCTTASLELNDNQAQKRDIDVNGISVWRGYNCKCWSQLNIETI